MPTWRSHAKINWYLRVLDRRGDGYHNIETVFQEIELADDLEIEPQDEPKCTITGMPFDLPPEKNLIYRAWDATRRNFPTRVRGIDVRIVKRIPEGGGLGGGSSNAATTLCALNELFSLGLGSSELGSLGAQLGSDVAFFVHGGCAIGRSRGEILEPVYGVQPVQIGLVFPPVRTSTAEAYRRLGELQKRPYPRHPLPRIIEALRSGDEALLADAAFNDFDAVYRCEPWFEQGAGLLRELGFERVMLSGSGSTLIGIKNLRVFCKKTLEPAIFEDRIQGCKNGKWVVLSTRATRRDSSERE